MLCPKQVAGLSNPVSCSSHPICHVVSSLVGRTMCHMMDAGNAVAEILLARSDVIDEENERGETWRPELEKSSVFSKLLLVY